MRYQNACFALLGLSLLTCGGEDEGGEGSAEQESQGIVGGGPDVGRDELLVDDDGTASGGSSTPSSSLGRDDDCAPNFTGIVRDFTSSHPDFEAYSGDAISPGIVEEDLGDDQKPVYNANGPNMRDEGGERAYFDDGGGRQTTSEADFDQWYRTVDGVNEEFEYALPFQNEGGRLVFDSSAFFPIDGRGFGNEGNDHNFWFTFELHTEFTYEGGEVFTFTGDDDLWAFVNGKLAVDVGGLHPARSAMVDLDAEASRLGIEIGQTYALDLFHAERHTDQSNFRVETNIEFTNCDPIFVDRIVR